MSTDINLAQVQARAKVMAREDRNMRRALVELRRDAGLTQQKVAEIMGCTQQAIQKLERYDADPQLSTLRRYANAIGALVSHTVQLDEGQSLWLAGRTGVAISGESHITVPRAAAPLKRAAAPSWGTGSRPADFSLAA